MSITASLAYDKSANGRAHEIDCALAALAHRDVVVARLPMPPLRSADVSEKITMGPDVGARVVGRAVGAFEVGAEVVGRDVAVGVSVGINVVGRSVGARVGADVLRGFEGGTSRDAHAHMGLT
jgi:hypothetical protein